MFKKKTRRFYGVDYSEGLFFVTICTQQHQHLFGQIKNRQMNLNAGGVQADNCWQEIPQHYPQTILHDYVIMPNHSHGILELRPGTDNYLFLGAHKIPFRAPFRSPSGTIGSVIRGFKIGVTKWFRQNTHVHDVWQPNYYERRIQNKQSYDRIAAYIMNNPAKWPG
jgi:putative transposase